MKRLILPAALFMLTGCPGPMDPAVSEFPAQVAVVDNRVCITVPAVDGEKIFSVQFASDSGQQMYKTFGMPDKQHPAVAGECLPTFGFRFNATDVYSAFYRLEKSREEPGRLFAARFSLVIDTKGNIRLAQREK